MRAVEFEGEWPVVGGIQGTTLSVDKLLEIGKRVQGGKYWDITELRVEDVKGDTYSTPWIPQFNDPAVPVEQRAAFSRIILRGCLLSGVCKSWVVSDEWNRLLPDYKFTGVETFLEKSWEGKA